MGCRCVAPRFFVDDTGIDAVHMFTEVVPVASHLDPTIFGHLLFLQHIQSSKHHRASAPLSMRSNLHMTPDIGVDIAIYEARSRACTRRVL